MSKIIEELFFVTRDGLRIRGMQFFPDAGNNKYPAIIFCHGFTGNYTHQIDICRHFASKGYATFAFSFCGGGLPDDPEEVSSDGSTTDATILTEVDDLIAVKDYVKRLPQVDDTRVILTGFSQGGFVAGLTAARCGDEIEKLIMIFPALCIPEHARLGCLGGSSYDPQNVPEIIDCGNTKLGKAFYDSVVSMDPYVELPKYNGKVLILHGLEDEVVNYSFSVRAKESYQKGQCHLQLIEAQGHGFDEGHTVSMYQSLEQFLKGNEEIFAIRIIVTTVKEEDIDGAHIVKVYFTGYNDTKYFRGSVTPEGCDTQQYKDGEVKFNAVYSLLGQDDTGSLCHVDIVNRNQDGEWKPTVKTDSNSLSWLNGKDLTGVLEFDKMGPVVRIFADNNRV